MHENILDCAAHFGFGWTRYLVHHLRHSRAEKR